MNVIERHLTIVEPALADASRAGDRATAQICLEAVNAIEWEEIIAEADNLPYTARSTLNWIEPALAGLVCHGHVQDIASLNIPGLVDRLGQLAMIGRHPPRGGLKMYTGGRLDHRSVHYTGTMNERDFASRIRQAEIVLKRQRTELINILKSKDPAVLADPTLPELLEDIAEKIAGVTTELSALVRLPRLGERAWIAPLRGYMAPFNIGGIPVPGPNPTILPPLEVISIALGTTSEAEFSVLKAHNSSLLAEERQDVAAQLATISLPNLLMQSYEALVARPAVNQNPNILAQAALCEPDEGILAAVTLRCARIAKEIMGLKQVYADVVTPFAPRGINTTSNGATDLASFDLKQLLSNSVARQTLIEVANLIEQQIDAE